MRTRRLCLLALFSLSLLLTPHLSLANTTSVNGTCIQGNCSMPDVLQPGGQATGFIAGSFTFANGDTFGFLGDFTNTESSDGLSISASHFMDVYFVGNNGGPAAGNDLIDLKLVQGYHVNTSGGMFGYRIDGSGGGQFGPNSTIQSSADINGVSIGTSPLFPLSEPFDWSSGFTQVKNIVNPLYLTTEYKINIGEGTLPGAFIDINSPEPGSVLLFSTALLGAVGSLRKKFNL